MDAQLFISSFIFAASIFICSFSLNTIAHLNNSSKEGAGGRNGIMLILAYHHCKSKLIFLSRIKYKVAFLLHSHYSICCGFSLHNEVEEHGSHSSIATVSVKFPCAWIMIPHIHIHPQHCSHFLRCPHVSVLM